MQSLLYKTCPKGKKRCATSEHITVLALRKGIAPCFQDLRERLDDARIFVAVGLHDVDEGDFVLWTVAERAKHWSESLPHHIQEVGEKVGVRKRSRKRKRVMLESTYADFAEGEILDLVRTSAPVNGGDETLPHALHKLSLGERLLLLLRLDGSDDLQQQKRRKCGFFHSRTSSSLCDRTCLVSGLIAIRHVLELLDDAFLNDGGLFLGPPLGDLRETFLLEVRLQNRAVALVGREEEEKVLDASTFEGSGEMVHGLVDKVSAEDERDDADGDICVNKRERSGRTHISGVSRYHSSRDGPWSDSRDTRHWRDLERSRDLSRGRACLSDPDPSGECIAANQEERTLRGVSEDTCTCRRKKAR
jgi:hypothetical protein